MDSSTSTASLILFPRAFMSREDLAQLQYTASLPLPPPPVPPKDYPVVQQPILDPQSSYHSEPSGSESEEAEEPWERAERRRRRRAERKREEMTSYRSEDGYLSPPPIRPNSRRRGRSTPPPMLRHIKSTPYLPLSHPLPHSAPNRSTPDLSLSLAISENFRPKMNVRPQFTKYRTTDDGLGFFIQPPLPSLLRPKSFWKNHPRSALTAPSYSPSSHLVRRSTFVAAGLDIDNGNGDDSNFGHSLWNASTLALAVESRTSDGGVSIIPGGGIEMGF